MSKILAMRNGGDFKVSSEDNKYLNKLSGAKRKT
jgi:hypothetical protein